MDRGPKISLVDGLDLRQVQSTGSVLHINTIYDEADEPESGEAETTNIDTFGKPIKNFKIIKEFMSSVDSNGFVKKLIQEEGGGMPIGEDCTVFVAFSAYWENMTEPFDVMTIKKPLEVDLKDSSILPGLEIAIKTMLVGEMSLFLFSHEVMYGEFGIPPRIKPAAECVFYIKLIRSVLPPKEGKLTLSQPNMFERVQAEVLLLYGSGVTNYNSRNFSVTANLFNRAIAMLHKCRLADEDEEIAQEKLLKKLYLNLAVCYIYMKKPLKACVACNELHRLDSLWNNGKALLYNAKALRMIGEYDAALKKLRRAIKLSPELRGINAEMELLRSMRKSCNQSKLLSSMSSGREINFNRFKEEVDGLIKNFKECDDLRKLTLPPNLNAEEMCYIKEACIKANLFFNKNSRNDAIDDSKDDPSKSEEVLDYGFMLAKEDESEPDSELSVPPELTMDELIFRQVELFVVSSE